MPRPLMHSSSASITGAGPFMRAKPLICRLDVDLNTALWRPGDCQTVTMPTLDVSRDFIWCLAKMPRPLMHSLSASITCSGPIMRAKPLICRLDVDLNTALWRRGDCPSYSYRSMPRRAAVVEIPVKAHGYKKEAATAIRLTVAICW